jgi:hypothetical protein
MEEIGGAGTPEKYAKAFIECDALRVQVESTQYAGENGDQRYPE